MCYISKCLIALRVWVDRKNVCEEKDKVVWPETLFYYLLCTRRQPPI